MTIKMEFCFIIITILCSISAIKAGIPYRYAQPVHWNKLNGEGRIIGGEIATHGQFPYQAAITMDDSGFCGGSLISDTVIMTAAHCADDKIKFEVWLGTQDRSTNESERRIFTTANKLVHYKYWTTDHQEYDIALLFAADAIPLTDYIQPIRLPTMTEMDTNESYVGVTGTVSGWGRNDESVPGAVDQLNYVNLTVIDSSACLEHYGFEFPSQLCMSVDGGKGSCSGDSGGPYVHTEEDGNLTQIGMVSYGSSAGCVGGPKGFMKIAFFLDWIQDHTGLNIRP